MRSLVATLTVLSAVCLCCGSAFSETPNDPYAIDDGNYADELPLGGGGQYTMHYSPGWWGHCNAWSLAIPISPSSWVIVLGTNGLEALVYIPHF